MEFFSRLDRDICWAVYDHTDVRFPDGVVWLHPSVDEHVSAVMAAADRFGIELPDRWESRREALSVVQ